MPNQPIERRVIRSMNDPWTQNDLQVASPANVKALKIVGAFVWIFTLTGFIWFLDYRTPFEKVVGMLGFVIGAFALVAPVNALGERKWKYAMYVFFALCAVLIILAQRV